MPSDREVLTGVGYRFPPLAGAQGFALYLNYLALR